MSERHISLGTFEPNDTARKYIADILDSGRISYGKYSKELESRFAELHECNYGVLSNSGTSSLQVALQAMKELYGWNDGDLVFVPASTFVATINVVLHCNLTPVLVDVRLDDYAMDPEKLQDAIWDANRQTKVVRLTLPPEGTPRCVIPVHPFGQSANMEEIINIATENELKIIEDSCEAMFVDDKGSAVGSMGDVGCFSFYVAHLVTAGVGGISVTNDPELAVRMRSLVNHGRDSIYISIDDDEDFNSEVIDKRFKFTSVGHSFRITELESALALAQIEDAEIEHMLEARRANANHVIAKIQSSEASHLLQMPVPRHEATHAYMMFPVLINESLDKSEMVYDLESRGIETRDMLPITNQPVYHELLGIKEEDYPRAKTINDQGFYVGCHQGLTLDDMEYLATNLIDCALQQGEQNE